MLYKQLYKPQIALIAEYESTIHVSTTVPSNAEIIKSGARL